MNEEIEQLRKEIEQHVRNAYALLPAELIPPTDYREREHLDWRFERKEWRQVCISIHWSCSNNLSPELLAENAVAYKKIGQLSCLVFQQMLLKISDEEKQLIGECLYAIASGPFLPDWEFSTLMGFEREKVAEIAEHWPSFDEYNDAVPSAIGSTLNNLARYPHCRESELPKYLSVSQTQMEEFADKWFALEKQLGD